MASAQSPVQLPTCPICQDNITQPKALDCQHKFCLKCLQELQKLDPETVSLLCPVCRHVTNLAGRSAGDLPDGLMPNTYLEPGVIALWQQLSQDQRSQSLCQGCDKNNPAISKCEDCDHLLCQECQSAHERLTVMKSHRIHMLDESPLGNSGMQTVSPNCESHSDQKIADQKITDYCKTCEQSVCKLCIEQAHNKHSRSVISLDEVLEECKQYDRKLKTEVDKTRAEFDMTIFEADKSRKKLDSMFQETNEKISQKAEEEVAKIRAEENQLKQEAMTFYKNKVRIFESARSANRKEVAEVVQVQHILSQCTAHASCFEAPDLQKSFLKSIQALKKKQPLEVAESLAFLDFTECEKSLGRLVLDDDLQMGDQSKSLLKPHKKEKWKLCKTEILNENRTMELFSEHPTTKFAFGVAAFSNNDLVIADTESHNLIKISPTGQNELSSSTEIDSAIQADRVSVNKGERLVVLYNDTILVFSRDYKVLKKFKLDQSDGKPTCLATEDNLIAVGYEEKQEVTLHYPDGSFVKRVPTTMIGSYLTIHQQKLIYTNWDNKKLLAVGCKGARVFSTDIKSPECWYGPTGLCCNSKGSIYVAVCGKWPFPGQIQQYSASGEFLGWIIEQCSTVYGMTLTKDENTLVVAAKDSVEFFQREPKKWQSLRDVKKRFSTKD